MRITRTAAPLLTAALGACAMGSPHWTSVDLSQVLYVNEGQGSPAVVFEAGMGNGMDTWQPVFEDVASTTTAIVYSRPGYAGKAFFRRQSDRKRTADDIAEVLNEVLEDTDVLPPYILVGHSVGGTYALRFATLYPDKVAGLVLVDARLKHFRERCEAHDLDLCSPPGLLGILQPDHVREEMAGLEETELQAPEPEELGDLPVTLIAATEPPAYASDEIQEVWLDVQREFAAGLVNGRYVVAEGSGHFIHQDDPELVVTEIRRMVEQIRARVSPVASVRP